MAFSLTNLTITILIVSLIVTTMGYYSSVGSRYNNPVPPSYQNVFNEYNKTAALVNENNNIVEQGQIDTSAFDVGIFKSAIIVLKSMRNSVKFVSSGITDLAGVIPIPVYLSVTLVAILTVSIIGVILLAFFKENL